MCPAYQLVWPEPHRESMRNLEEQQHSTERVNEHIFQTFDISVLKIMFDLLRIGDTRFVIFIGYKQWSAKKKAWKISFKA